MSMENNAPLETIAFMSAGVQSVHAANDGSVNKIQAARATVSVARANSPDLVQFLQQKVVAFLPEGLHVSQSKAMAAMAVLGFAAGVFWMNPKGEITHPVIDPPKAAVQSVGPAPAPIPIVETFAKPDPMAIVAPKAGAKNTVFVSPIHKKNLIRDYFDDVVDPVVTNLAEMTHVPSFEMPQQSNALSYIFHPGRQFAGPGPASKADIPKSTEIGRVESARIAAKYFNAKTVKMAEEIHPDLIRILARARETTGIHFEIVPQTGGRRNIQMQANLVAKGASKTMTSRHLYGLAADIVPYTNGVPDFFNEKTTRIIDLAMRAAAAEFGIPAKSGLDFRGFPDLGHFELSMKEYGRDYDENQVANSLVGSLTNGTAPSQVLSNLSNGAPVVTSSIAPSSATVPSSAVTDTDTSDVRHSNTSNRRKKIRARHSYESDDNVVIVEHFRPRRYNPMMMIAPWRMFHGWRASEIKQDTLRNLAENSPAPMTMRG